MAGLLKVHQSSPFILQKNKLFPASRSGVEKCLKGHFFFLTVFIALLFASCAPATVEDFHKEGRAAVRALADEMRKIESQDDLRMAVPKLRKRYIRLARLAVRARELKERGFEPLAPSQASDELFAEIARLYELPGGRELLMEAEREAFKFLE